MPTRQFQASYPTSRVGAFLKFHRQRNLLTLEEASHTLNMVPKHIQDIEKQNIDNVKSFTMSNICNAFNQTVEDYYSFDVNTKIHIVPEYVWDFITLKYSDKRGMPNALSRKSGVSIKVIRELRHPDKGSQPRPSILLRLCKGVKSSPHELTDYSTVRYYVAHPHLEMPKFYTP